MNEIVSSKNTARPDFVRTYSNGVLQIAAASDRAFRVRFTPPGAQKDMPASTILLDGLEAPSASVSQKNGTSVLDLPALRCEVADDTGRLRFFDRDGNLLLEETVNGRRLTPSRLGDEPVHSVEQSFESPENERLYGTGCFQDGALDIRSLPRRLTQVNSQISLPFILSSRGYGLMWHHKGRSEFNTPPHMVTLSLRDRGASETSSVSTSEGNAEVERRFASFEGEITIKKGGRQAMLLDIGQKMGSRYTVEIDGKTYVDLTNFWLPPTMSFFAELAAGTHKVKVEANDTDKPVLYFGPAENRTVWRAPVAEAIDYIVIAGPSAAEIMGGYRDLLGKTPMPPLWSFGYVHCRERFHSTEEIIETLDEFRRRELPVDVMVQDWQYWGKHGWNAMRFDEDHYPDPSRLTDELHKRKARFMLSVWSRIGRQTELGKIVADRGFYLPDTEWVDFFNPEAVDFYCTSQNERLGHFGIDAWWQDATEPENDDLDGRMTAKGRGEHEQLTYPLQVTRSVYQSRRAAEPDKRVMILTRCAFLGQQRYGAMTWSGDIGNDYETLRRQIPAGLNMAAAGYPFWTVDAGGFFRPGPGQFADKDYHQRFIRWFQYATFLPMQRVHGYETNTEFWRYGAEVEAISKAYLELRYRLLPYVYSIVAETSRTGVPMMRPLVFDFVHDERALDEAHSYMFGAALHVAPVFEADVGTWPIYLPETEGGWFDLWTGEHRVGGKVHDVPAPIEKIPLHARAGSVVPFGPVLQSTAEATNECLDLYVFPGRDGVFSLYEDDGRDNGYETGASSLIPISWDDAANTLDIGTRQGSYPGMQGNRRFIVHKVAPGVTPMTPGEGVVILYSGEATRTMMD